jgi:hypothetical protein
MRENRHEGATLVRPAEHSRSPLRLKAGYFPGCEVMRMSTNDSGAGGGIVDFLPYRGMALDSESSYSLLKHVAPSSKNSRA